MSQPIAIELPVPYPVATANAYLLLGEPLTLFDAGARTPEALAALEAALSEHGLRVEDVELLVLTHHHVDHVGLAETVRVRSGCTVATHGRAAAVVRDLPAARAADDAWAAVLLDFHGAPPEAVAEVPLVSAAAAGFTESVEVARELVDGDTLLAGGRKLHVRLRPGHSFSDTIFVDRDGWAIVGDHVLGVGPAAALTDLSWSGGELHRRASALLAYRDSLAATAADGLASGFPGHGGPLDDPAATIATRLASQEKHAARLLAELEDGPRTAWELVGATRGGRSLDSGSHPISLSYVTLAGVLGYLDLLVAQGRARVLERGNEPPLYRAA